MGKKKLSQDQCFPGVEGLMALREPITPSSISKVIDEVYRNIMQQVQEAFQKNPTALQKDRGKLHQLKQSAEEELGVGGRKYRDGINTIGVARRFGAKVRKLVKETGTTGTKWKDRLLSPQAHAIVRKAVEEVIGQMTIRISKATDFGAVSSKTEEAGADDPIAASKTSQGQLLSDESKHDDAEAMTQAEEPENETVWQLAMKDPRIMRDVLQAILNDSAEEELTTGIPDEDVLGELEELESINFAASILDALETRKKLPDKLLKGKNKEGWCRVYDYFSDQVEDEIRRGDTSFTIDELELAFESRLREVGLWKKYCEEKKTSDSEVDHGVDSEKQETGEDDTEDEEDESSIASLNAGASLFQTNPDMRRMLAYDLNHSDLLAFMKIADDAAVEESVDSEE